MSEYWVVVVDDEPLSLINAKNLLREQHMKVSLMRSGKDLLKFVEKNTPDLILLDVRMPEMDGFETYEAYRKVEEEKGRIKTPVIFLTGENDIETERRGLRAGASDYIRKPFDRDILLERINNIIEQSKQIETLTEEATTDRLTGFLNKVSGTESVRKLCEEKTGALMILDLDSFKLVNDLFGHDMGDNILRTFAGIIRKNTREKDLVCRIGGDEFMAFFTELQSEEAVASLTSRINEQLLKEAEKLMGPDFGIPLGISAGVAWVPRHGRDYDVLFACADKALYTVKENGKHGYLVHSETVPEDVSVENDVPGDLSAEIRRITKIVEERNEAGGALLLSQAAFSTIYRYMERFRKHYGGDATRILFSLTAEDGDAAILSTVSEQFAATLQRSIRRSDIIMQHKANQFFLFLPGLSAENVSVVTGRILANWQASEYAARVQVSFASAGV